MASGVASFSAGDLQTRITIQEKVDASDGQGGTTHTWGGVGHEWGAWARKRYLSGGDATEADQTVTRKRFEYTIRRRQDVTITEAMRVVDGSMTLAIVTAALDDTDRSAMLIIAEEVPT